VELIQESVTAQYRQILQTIRDAWVFQSEGVPAWQRMDLSMTKMKQLAHSAEEIAENGLNPRLTHGEIIKPVSFPEAVSLELDDVRKTIKIHEKLRSDKEAGEHGGLMTNLDLTLRQEDYESGELRDWLAKKQD
jgi:hypothetical protein